MAVAALVLGIIGLFFAWIPLLGYVMPVLAIIFGVIERNNEEKRAMALSGLILGIISLVIFKLGFWILVMIGVFSDSIRGI
ncbi:DUF4190 domain-containing protein [Bacillus sp. JJ1521]|uniref:DUF4190 domain-containing protein n=1 Tax=Bacillus sp. JJ1521 TaxID=3122957 RepID=UPI002FFDBAB6